MNRIIYGALLGLLLMPVTVFAEEKGLAILKEDLLKGAGPGITRQELDKAGPELKSYLKGRYRADVERLLHAAISNNCRGSCLKEAFKLGGRSRKAADMRAQNIITQALRIDARKRDNKKEKRMTKERTGAPWVTARPEEETK